MNTPTTDMVVLMQTNKGNIKVRVFLKDTPITSRNFLELVTRGFYNGLTFHRYEKDFCLQGGCPQGTGFGGSGTNIPLEIAPHLRHDAAGVLAMARADDPNSASSQFYFTLAPADFLDGNYAVFGKIQEGMDVLMALRKGDKMINVSVQEAVKAQ
jgi:peptidyl-prolyl cis-trans isomerase B (cyclophilin B)